jgi:hypothetical protein
MELGGPFLYKEQFRLLSQDVSSLILSFLESQGDWEVGEIRRKQKFKAAERDKMELVRPVPSSLLQ